jgi:hypothetical protein
MAGAFGMTKIFAALGLSLGLAAGAAAQHPFFGPDHPAPDPRSKAENSVQTSVNRTVEFGNRQGVESCAFRAVGLRRPDRAYFVDEWALGVERQDGKTTLFFETRVVDSAGVALAIERPTLYMYASGPTYDWQPGRSNSDGYVRIEKDIEAASSRELIGFTTAVEEQGVKELAITLPDGRGDAYVALANGATPRQFEFFAACVCKILGIDGNDLFQCP